MEQSGHPNQASMGLSPEQIEQLQQQEAAKAQAAANTTPVPFIGYGDIEDTELYTTVDTKMPDTQNIDPVATPNLRSQLDSLPATADTMIGQYKDDVEPSQFKIEKYMELITDHKDDSSYEKAANLLESHIKGELRHLGLDKDTARLVGDELYTLARVVTDYTPLDIGVTEKNLKQVIGAQQRMSELFADRMATPDLISKINDIYKATIGPGFAEIDQFVRRDAQSYRDSLSNGYNPYARESLTDAEKQSRKNAGLAFAQEIIATRDPNTVLMCEITDSGDKVVGVPRLGSGNKPDKYVDADGNSYTDLAKKATYYLQKDPVSILIANCLDDEGRLRPDQEQQPGSLKQFDALLTEYNRVQALPQATPHEKSAYTIEFLQFTSALPDQMLAKILEKKLGVSDADIIGYDRPAQVVDPQYPRNSNGQIIVTHTTRPENMTAAQHVAANRRGGIPLTGPIVTEPSFTVSRKPVRPSVGPVKSLIFRHHRKNNTEPRGKMNDQYRRWLEIDEINRRDAERYGQYEQEMADYNNHRTNDRSPSIYDPAPFGKRELLARRIDRQREGLDPFDPDAVNPILNIDMGDSAQPQGAGNGNVQPQPTRVASRKQNRQQQRQAAAAEPGARNGRRFGRRRADGQTDDTEQLAVTNPNTTDTGNERRRIRRNRGIAAAALILSGLGADYFRDHSNLTKEAVAHYIDTREAQLADLGQAVLDQPRIGTVGVAPKGLTKALERQIDKAIKSTK